MGAPENESAPSGVGGSHDETRASRAPASQHDPHAETVDGGLSMLSDGEAHAPTLAAGDAEATLRARGLSERPGTLIGRYKLLRKIGEGGFGLVFLAQQEQPVRREVALKIIKLGMDTRQVVARFEQERQALALMDHPNIAKVLDAGATDTGRPYFVMEYCPGDSITHFCDNGNLTIRERLSLFVQVCHAVQHAHQKGLIHRDIKPSNVLVSAADGKPHVKVIDFGVAKATAARLTEQTLFTAEAQFIGTPQYMSPEQAAGSLDIDTRTDVYALGVLLYELLTGVTPFDPRTLRSAAYAEIQRIIREVEPPSPSTRLAARAETLASVAASRRVEPRRLSSMIRGELDWIVMKALEKDRARRYDSANEFAADVLRFLSGDPVEAAPPSAAYRLRKFARRHKGPVLAAGAVTIALVAGLAGTLWQAGVAAQQRDRARSEAIRADDRAAAAQRAEAQATERAAELALVADFQSSMLSQVDAAAAGIALMSDIRAKFAEALSRSDLSTEQRSARTEAFERDLARVSATDVAANVIDRTILTPAVQAVGLRFQQQPRVDSALRQTLAQLYRTLGRYEAALPLQERALAGRQRVLGGEHVETLETELSMARLLQAQGKWTEAEVRMRATLETSRRVLGDDDAQTLHTIYALGLLMREANNLAEAETLHREAETRARRVLGEDHPDALNYLSGVGLALQVAGQRAEAETILRDALAKHRRINGEDHRDTARAICTYGYLLKEMGRQAEAESYLREGVEKLRRLQGESHPDTLMAMNNLATLVESLGRASEAEALYSDTLQKSRRTLGDDHPETLRTIANLANLLRSERRLAEAEPLAFEAMNGSRRVLGGEHRSTLVAINIYGYLLTARNRHAEAEPYWREAYETGRRTLGEDHPDVIVWTNNLGGLMRTLGRLDEAEPLLLEALAKSRRANGEEHPSTLFIGRGAALLLQRRQKFAEAEPLLREVLDKRRRLLPADHADTLTSINDLAGLLRAAGRPTEAEPLFREALDTHQRLRGDDHWSTANARMALAGVLTEQGRWADAAAALRAAECVLAVATDAPPERHAQCLDALRQLYEVWDEAEPGAGHGDEAENWRRELAAARAATQPASRGAP